MANGSDFPVEEPNPLWGFYAAVTRQDRDGKPAGGWFPDQRMTREEALRSWTITGAYAAFEEKRKGSLAPGKMADLVLLSADIMKIAPAEILKTRVLATVVADTSGHHDMLCGLPPAGRAGQASPRRESTALPRRESRKPDSS
mgnify:CR=1 FL=1